MQHIQISNLENSHWSWQKCVRSNWGHKPKRVGNHSFILHYHFCHTGQRSSNEYCILFVGDALVVVSSFPRLQHCSKIFEQQMFCWLLCLWILCVQGPGVQAWPGTSAFNVYVKQAKCHQRDVWVSAETQRAGAKLVLFLWRRRHSLNKIRSDLERTWQKIKKVCF